MLFEKPLISGTFLKRYKRFFADVKIGKDTVVAHVPNTGSMKGCNTPNSLCLLSKSDDPKRKLQYTFQMIEIDGTWVGVNTANPNKLAREAFDKGLIPHWKNFDACASEVKISDASRVDMVLWNDCKELSKSDRPKFPFGKKPLCHFVEVKNVTLGENKVAYFPDSVSERAQKHIEELLTLKKKGHSAELLFVVQRDDCKVFKPADHIDPEYGKLLRKAHKEGVMITPVVCKLSEKGIEITKKILPVEF